MNATEWKRLSGGENARVYSQLELLYKLGILEQDPARKNDGDTHNQFLVSLPSPSIPPTLRRKPRWIHGNHQESICEKESLANDWCMHRPAAIFPDKIDSCIKFPSSFYSRDILRHPAPSFIKSTVPDQGDTKRIFFLQWKLFMENHKEKQQLRMLCYFHTKKRTIRTWCGFVRGMRQQDFNCRQVEDMRLRRAARHWRRWSCRRQRIRNLLHSQRHSFLGNLIKQRVWKRWKQFIAQNVIRRARVHKRIETMHNQILKTAWQEWRIVAFRARIARKWVQICMSRLHAFHCSQNQKRQQLMHYQHALTEKRKHYMLLRWRRFTYKRARERTLTFRICSRIMCKRFLQLWLESYQYSRRLRRFRMKMTRNIASEHLHAWYTTVKAIQMAHRRMVIEQYQHQSDFFCKWHEATLFIRTYKNATHRLNSRKLVRALDTFTFYTSHSKRLHGVQRHLQVKHKRKILNHVWCDGWIVFHRKAQRQSEACKHLQRIIQRGIFGRWKIFWSNKIVMNRDYLRADVLCTTLTLRRFFNKWQNYQKHRHTVKIQRKKVETYFHERLLLKGVVCLWNIVKQRNQWAERSHQIRRNARLNMKHRYFREWRKFTRTKMDQIQRVNTFHTRSQYQLSICNPRRRIWDRWIKFKNKEQQQRYCDRIFQRRLKRNVFHVWHRSAALLRIVYQHRQKKQTSDLQIAFDCWRQQYRHWQKVHELSDLAHRFYRKKTCIKVFREWSYCCRRYFKRLRECSAYLLSKQKKNWFWLWHTEFRTRRLLRNWVDARHTQLKETIFEKWHRYFIERTKLTQKLHYFHRVVGKYPTTTYLRRYWTRWKQFSIRRCRANVLRIKIETNLMKQYWNSWSRYHIFCCLFHQWQNYAFLSSKARNQLGKRLRLFREFWLHQHRRHVFSKWKMLLEQRRNLDEKIAYARYLLNLEMIQLLNKRDIALKFYIRQRFRSWRTRAHDRNWWAQSYFRRRLLRKTLRLWWTRMIQCKQELLLLDAKRALGRMSFYHPHRQAYVGKQMKENKRQLRSIKRMELAQIEHFRKARRMVDPIKAKKYSGHHQQDVRTLQKVKLNVNRSIVSMHRAGREKNERKVDFESGIKADGHPIVHHCPIMMSEVNNKALISTSDEQKNAKDPIKDVSDNVVPCHNEPESQLPLTDNESIRHVNIRQSEYHSNEEAQQSSANVTAPNILPLFDCDSSDVSSKQQFHTIHERSVNETNKFVDNKIHPWTSTDSKSKSKSTSSPPIPTTIVNHSGHVSSAIGIARSSDSLKNTTDLTSLEKLALIDVYRDEHIPEKKPPQVKHNTNIQDSQRKNHRKETRTRHYKTHRQPRFPATTSVDTDLSLAGILEIDIEHQYERTHTGMQQEDVSANCVDTNPICGDELLRQISFYYATRLAERLDGASSDDETVASMHMRICFEMLRDLALLTNDFYIREVEQTLKSMDLTVDTEAYRSTTMEMREALVRVEQSWIEDYLHQVIVAHPLYLAYERDNEKQAKQRIRFNQSAPFLPTLKWLVEVYLPPLLSTQTCEKKHERSTAIWIRHLMPIDMTQTLTKILACVKKYNRSLCHFFTWNIATREAMHLRRMTKSDFIALMKHSRMFLQLFHRRELETAVVQSCCSRPWSQELNFPEFIEALFRCSCNLQWGYQTMDGNVNRKEAEVAIVMKFLMLIFSMEGKGSVLQKRNDDLKVVIKYLEQHQQSAKADKLLRFRRVLDAHQKHKAAKETSSRQRSIWIGLNGHSMRRTAPRAKTQNWTSDVIVDDNVEFPSTTQHRGVSISDTIQPSLGLLSGEESDLDLVEPTDDLDYYQVANVRSNDHHNGELISQQYDSLDLSRPQRDDNAFNHEAIHTQRVEKKYKDEPTQITFPKTLQSPIVEDTNPHFAVDVHHEPHLFTPLNSSDEVIAAKPIFDIGCPTKYWMKGPKHKDEFLDDILSCIGDTELLLQQSKFANKRSSSSAMLSSSQIGRVNSVDQQLTNHSPLFTGSQKYLDRDNDQCTEVEVQDPLLNHLTDIERFTESTEWKTDLTATDITEYGTHAMFQSSLHSLAELDDMNISHMTDPTLPTFYRYTAEDESASDVENAMILEGT